jgi:hypothetical protein
VSIFAAPKQYSHQKLALTDSGSGSQLQYWKALFHYLRSRLPRPNTKYANGAAQQWVVADRLAACKIGRFLRFGISTSLSLSGVGDGRKAAAKP